MTSPTPFLAHLAEALRAHRQRVGVGRVPAAFVALEVELLAALSGTPCAPTDSSATVGHSERVAVTTEEAAEMLALSPRKVRELRAAGRLPAVVVDRAVRYRVDDLHKFVEENREKGRSS